MCKVNFAVTGRKIMPLRDGATPAQCGLSSTICQCRRCDRRQRHLDKREGVFIITFTVMMKEVLVPRKKPDSTKQEFLRQHGVLNPNPAAVADSLFQDGEFFDPHDLVQVKYEMLRRVQIDKRSVSESAVAFGFSRPTFYQAQQDFEHGGLTGLIPEKRGPRGAHKLTSEVIEFLQQLRTSQPAVRAAEMAAAVAEHFAVTVHPRSVERRLRPHQKKR